MPRQNPLFRRLYDRPYGFTNSFHLFDATKNSKDLLQRLRLEIKIPAHTGCVNSICWNDNGKYLLSGSDDRHLCVTDGYSHNVLAHVPTGHRSNIFSAKFLPGGDNRVVSCSGDGVIIYSDFDDEETSMSNRFNCHFGTAYEVMTIPNDPNTFLSCGEDGTVRWFDLRIKSSCSRESCKEDVLINCHSGVSALGLNPVCPYQLAVGCADATVRIFDRRMLCTSATGGYKPKSGIEALMANFTVPEFTTNHRITSLKYSQDGQEMLISYSSDFIYLFDVKCSFDKEPKVLSRHTKEGSKNAMGKARSRPLMKRLRVRGDWSDTGPNARPESEARGEPRSRTLHASLMQRMSDVLTSMYNQRSRGQGTVSSHSEDSEMDEAEGNNAEDQQSQPEASSSDSNNNSQPRESSPYAVPVFSQSERIDEENEEDEAPESDRAYQRQSGGDGEPSIVPSGDFADISFKVSPIKVSPDAPLSGGDGQSTSVKENSEALNLSLQNLKEMSRSKQASETIEKAENSVIKTESSSHDSSSSIHNAGPSTILENGEDLKSATSHGASASCDETVHENESPNDNCDNQEAVDATENCDAHNTSAESEERRGSSSSRDSVPDIFVATVPTSDGANSSREEETPSQVEGQMTFMMEMDSWDMDSEEEAPTASQNNSRLDFDAPCEAALPEDEATEEDLEREEQERMDQLPHPQITNRYMGHRNARTMIKEATFWGDNFVMSGSDCGHIFVWDRYTTELVMLMEADHHVVNCLQPHPFDPILASSGIDYDIKIWSPLHHEPLFDEEKAKEIIKRNKVMLEETKDTITVPASFMIRMLASLNHITSGSGWRRMARHLREGARRYR